MRPQPLSIKNVNESLSLQDILSMWIKTDLLQKQFAFFILEFQLGLNSYLVYVG